MKKRLLLITFVIIFAFGAQSGFLGTSFVRGFMDGWNSYEEVPMEHVMFLDIHLTPEVSGSTVGELINEKTGEVMPANIRSATVNVAPDTPFQTYQTISAFLLVGAIILIAVYFLKIIIAVNRSVVFDWINVKRIRNMGIGLLVVFVLDFGNFIYSKILVDQLIEIEGYRTIGNESFSFLYFILGLSAFLIAEVFAIGLRLREEQELTI
ncbi:DUF2975 domain-containing protein [Parabacteroides sp. OttesenSCG-928-J18]|nr:DUF2975 domain-containing protein [Parabacteroides sp. OttesenSCG-928-J18]